MFPAIVVGSLILVGRMAANRGRNAFFWVCTSFLGTPVLVIVMLRRLGNAPD
jgi:hypothetical protein